MAILTIGMSCLDQFFYIRDFPERNKKVFSYKLLESGGGPCGNASYLLGKWKQEVYHIATLGLNSSTDVVEKELTSVGVNLDFSVKSKFFATPQSTILVNENGDRTIISYKSFEDKIFQPYHFEAINVLINKLNQRREKIIVLIDGHEEELANYIIPKLTNKIVVMDAGNMKESLLRLAKHVDYPIVSESFASSLIKKEVKGNEIEALQEIKKLCGKCTPVITLGDKGCVYFKNKLYAIPAMEVETVDTTGAGDLFHGAFCYGLNNKWQFEDSLLLATCTSGLSIQKQGVREAIPTLEEVNQQINLINKI